MTSAPAVIKAEGISKRYRIGALARTHDTLRDAVADAFQRSTRRLKNLARNESAGDGQDGATHILALNDVSFEVAEGEVVGLIGKNGSGKSTLLKILSRITEPTLGRAEIHGTLGSLLEVGTGFHPELTGRENMYLSGAILGMKKGEIARKFDEIVAFAEIEKFIDTPVKFYSSGMYVRLAFAVAAHLEPEILLVDEVLAVGDAAFQRKCLGKMGDAARRGRTVVFVSHNMAAIRSLCTRAMMLSDGKLVFAGDVDECVDRYLLDASDDLTAVVLTAGLPRPEPVAHEEALRITRVTLVSPRGPAVLAAGDPMEVVLEFVVRETLGDVILGWGVHSSDDVRIFETRSWTPKDAGSTITPGTYTIRSKLTENPLNAGIYTMHVGARCPEKGLDWLPNVLVFRIEPQRVQSVWMESPTGLVRVNVDWDRPHLVPADAPAHPVERSRTASARTASSDRAGSAAERV